jgi:hypothetical protein
MTRRVAPYFGTAVLIVAFSSLACSSADNTGTGTTGQGGMAVTTGTGGAGGAATTGTGGTTTANGPTGDPCPSGVKNKGVCAGTEPACWNTCGPLKSGFKNCVCTGGMWSCPSCAYYPEDMTAHNYSCYKIPATIALCPADPTDPTMAGLPQSGATCNIATCMPCGSSSSNAYRDSTGTPKIGYCVCSASDGTGTYSCASLAEWAPPSMF